VVDDYQFVNLALGESPDPANPRPVVYYGGVTDLLDDPAIAPRLCALPWLTPAEYDALAEVETSCRSNQIIRVP